MVLQLLFDLRKKLVEGWSSRTDEAVMAYCNGYVQFHSRVLVSQQLASEQTGQKSKNTKSVYNCGVILFNDNMPEGLPLLARANKR